MNMDSKTEEQQLQEQHRSRMAALAADKKRIFAMPPEKALDAILEHPMNRALVHSMAEEDFFFLINDTGHYDAMEILALASNRQWEYLLDIESWHRDRMQLDVVVYWMNLLHQAAPGRFIEWAMNEKYDLLEYFLYRTAEIIVRDHDVDPGDIEDGFFTYDDIFYIRFSNEIFAGIDDEEDKEELENFVYSMIQRIAEEDHIRYQSMLLHAASVIPDESEEEAFRFRNIRLAEKGFLPFDEAVGIYSILKPRKIRKKHQEKIETDFTVPVPVNHTSLLKNDTLFEKALESIDIQETLDEVQVEFASLCNRIIAADQNPVRGKEQLNAIVNKACGYLEIGIHRVAETEILPGASHAASIIKIYPLEDIFRTGYSMILELKNKALRWHKDSWFTKNRLALSFWGENLVGYVGGLLLKHPKFFDNYKSGQLYREFSSMDDIKKAEEALNEVMIFDQILSFVKIDTSAFPDQHFVTFQNLLLTLWSRNRIGLLPVNMPEPIAIESFRPFYGSLWDSEKNAGRIKDSVKADFLDWISSFTGLAPHEIVDNASNSLEKLFCKIEDEFAAVNKEDLDYRFIDLFLLKK